MNKKTAIITIIILDIFAANIYKLSSLVRITSPASSLPASVSVADTETSAIGTRTVDDLASSTMIRMAVMRSARSAVSKSHGCRALRGLRIGRAGKRVEDCEMVSMYRNWNSYGGGGSRRCWMYSAMRIGMVKKSWLWAINHCKVLR